jgi:hypothetical protein
MAGIVGSEISGPTNLANLESSDFKIKIVSEEAANTCAAAELEKDVMTVHEPEQRDSVVDYNIYTQ